MPPTSFRVAIADDHPALLIGISHELSTIRDVDVVGAATSSDELIRILDGQACEVLVTDYAMSGGTYGDGADWLAYLRRSYPATRIVILTMVSNSAIIRTILTHGVSCLVSKADPAFHIAQAVRVACIGGSYLSPKMADIVDVMKQGAAAKGDLLTRRESEVMRLYVSGMTINEIAAQLRRTKQTISAQKISAMKKLGIERDSDLFRYALETGLLA